MIDEHSEQPQIRQSGFLPLQMNRTIFKAIDPYLKNQDYLFKTKKNHFRHRSQPLQNENQKANMSHRPSMNQSFQQILKRTKQKASHQRIVSQISQSIHIHHEVKKPKYNQFQYNKWYIKPQFRMKKPLQNTISPQKRFTQTQFCQNHYQNLFKQKIFTETQDLNSNDPFHKKQNPNLSFAKNFVQKDANKKNINLLRQFKRKQSRNRARTPQLVELILQMNLKNKKLKQKNKLYPQNSKNASKHNSTSVRDSQYCSKNVSKFEIQDLDCIKLQQKKNSNGYHRQSKRLTLLQSQFAQIKANITDKIKNDLLGDNFKIHRLKVR